MEEHLDFKKEKETAHKGCICKGSLDESNTRAIEDRFALKNKDRNDATSTNSKIFTVKIKKLLLQNVVYIAM